jgi:hypothetical protein
MIENNQKTYTFDIIKELIGILQKKKKKTIGNARVFFWNFVAIESL